MCGFCGFVGPPGTGADVGAGRAMTELLAHRGPDGHGELELAATRDHGGLEGWLGHRRLKIVDLSEEAHQPMTSGDGKTVLVYNGEVYNFRELRRELVCAGHRFRSSGDTEVVLRAYEQWGEACVERLDGMFALAVWDERRGRMLLARDRTGKKPLFYTLLGGRLTFASEIKALLRAPWVETGLDESKLPEFLAFGYVPYPDTLFRGIHQVPPAATVTYDREGLGAVRPYWDALPTGQRDRSARDLGPSIARRLAEATERRLIADVPLGALLSGGVDSSIVVGLMSRAATERVRTFSIGFPEEASFDERPYARRVADHFGTAHTEFAVKADAVALMDTLLWHYDQPYHDSSAIPTYLVSQLAREHVTVVLNGDGGDEVFGGYDRFRAAAVAEFVPGWAAATARRVARRLPRNHGYYSPRRRAERFLELAEMPVLERYQSWIGVMNRELLDEALTPRVKAAADLAAVTRSMEACYARAASLPRLDAILYANFKTYLPDDLAVKMDRMSMANSLEARSPFLDTAVIELLAPVRARRKVGMRTVKPLLRRALRPLLPDEIWNRRKHGFGVPLGLWFRTGELGTLFEDEVLGDGARTGELLEVDVLQRLWDEHRRGEREHGFRLWTVLTLERWLRAVERPALASPPARAVLSA